MKTKVCMIVQDKMVKGGIAAVISGYYDSFLEDNYDITYVESYKDGSKSSKIFKALKAYFQFAKILMIEKPDIIHVHSSFGPSFYRKIPFIYMANWKGVPIINHVHGADFSKFYLEASTLKKIVVKKVYGKCSKIISLSEEWRDNFRIFLPEKNIVVIENYSIIAPDAYSKRMKKKSKNKILFLGEIGKRKGCFDIPNIMRLVTNEISDVELWICGDGEKEDVEWVKKELIKLGVFENCLFPGWVRNQEKNDFLSDADLFFLPSYNEGMPMSVLDAMGYGLPIVSTKVGGIPKIVLDNINGLCNIPGDVNGLANSIIYILKNNNIRHSLGAQSIQLIKEKYSLDKHLGEIQEIYEEVSNA